MWLYLETDSNVVVQLLSLSNSLRLHGLQHDRPPCPFQFQSSHSVMSSSLRPHELQHARPPCTSPTPGVHSDSSPSSQWWHPAISSSVIPFSPSYPAFNLSQHQGLLKWVSSSHQVAKVLEFQFQHQSFQWKLISFRMDWFDLHAVKGTLKSLLQHHSSKVSILRCLAFFMVQLSHPCMTTRKHSFD